MVMKIGERTPNATLYRMTSEGPGSISSEELLGKGKTVLFAVPGAFTPACSDKHLPGYLAQYDALVAKGVDRIVCLSVNDAFVMAAWGKDRGVGDKIMMVADGGCEFTRKAGLEFDLTERGLGVRSKRYAALIEDGFVRELEVEDGAGVDRSSAEKMLAKL